MRKRSVPASTKSAKVIDSTRSPRAIVKRISIEAASPRCETAEKHLWTQNNHITDATQRWREGRVSS